MKKLLWSIITFILMVSGVFFVRQCVFEHDALAASSARYYITDEKRETKQYFVEEDWPIVKDWGLKWIWTDTNSTTVAFETKGGLCAVTKFKTSEGIDTEEYKNIKQIKHKRIPCVLMNNERERQIHLPKADK